MSWVTKGGHKVKEAVWELGIDANGLSHWKRKLLEQGRPPLPEREANSAGGRDPEAATGVEATLEGS